MELYKDPVTRPVWKKTEDVFAGTLANEDRAFALANAPETLAILLGIVNYAKKNEISSTDLTTISTVLIFCVG